MSNVQPLAAEPRERAGKGSARAARREGRVPAVIYGEKKPPTLITVGRNELVRLISKGTFMTNLFEIEVAIDSLATQTHLASLCTHFRFSYGDGISFI